VDKTNKKINQYYEETGTSYLKLDHQVLMCFQPTTSQLDTDAQKLFRACGEGDIATIKSILESHNFDFGLRDEEGNTLLHWACVSGNTAVVAYLLENLKGTFSIAN
jgi:ankyrin repeat protein